MILGPWRAILSKFWGYSGVSNRFSVVCGGKMEAWKAFWAILGPWEAILEFNYKMKPTLKLWKERRREKV